MRGFPFGRAGSPVALAVRARRSCLREVGLSADGPDEAAKFAGDSDDGAVLVLPAGCEPRVPRAQPFLRPPGDALHLLRDASAARKDGRALPRSEAIGPGCFDEDSPRVGVAGTRDPSLLPCL